MRLISLKPNSASPGLGFVPRDWRFAGSSRHTPMQNHLLAALPAADYERLLPALELVPPLRLGWAIHEAGGQLGYVWFPTNGIVSLLYVMENGASAETAITGNEGCIGIASKWAPFIGTAAVPPAAVVRGPVGFERADDDAGSDRMYVGGAPRRRRASRREAAKGRSDRLQARPHYRAGSSEPGSAGLRVLRSG